MYAVGCDWLLFSRVMQYRDNIYVRFMYKKKKALEERLYKTQLGRAKT